MRKILFISGCLIFLIYSDLLAQDVKFSFETGVGTYSMKDLKLFMTESTQANPLNPVMVREFPPYLYFSPSISFGINNHNIGFKYTLMSTGARSSIKDYSGEYRFDGTIAGNAITIFDEYYVYQTPKYGFLLKLDLGGVYSRFKMHEYFQLNDIEQLNESYRFYSINLYTIPGVKFNYDFDMKLSLFATAGYHIDILKSPLYLEKSKRNMYLVYNSEKLKANWDGLRIGIGISYKL